jgi:hypothetical protein
MILKAPLQKSPVCAMALLVLLPFTAAHAEPSAAVCAQYADSHARQHSAKGQVLAGAAGGRVSEPSSGRSLAVQEWVLLLALGLG